MGAPPTQQPTLKQHAIPARIVCRCCLSEEDEMTDYLSLNAIAAITFRDICNDDDAAGSESSPSSTTTTLLDCLNGCARIGATLEDASLPLHICLDCSQALEACCEFIRCVQNADKILRRKQQSAILPKEATSAAEKVVDLKLLAQATTSGESLAEQQEQLAIGSLSLQDLIEDSELQYLGLGKALKSSEIVEGQSFDNNSNCLTSTVNTCSNEDTLIPCINFDFSQNKQLLETSLQNSKNETATLTYKFKNEICEFLTTNSTTTNSKDCNTVHSNAIITADNILEKGIPETHKFIPPLGKDITHYDPLAENESYLATDIVQTSSTVPTHSKDNQHNSRKTSFNKTSINADNVPFKNFKKTQCATLNFDGRKYIVNAAIAQDLKKFHKDNEDNFNYLCKFCIFMCVSQKALDQHLITHLGSPCYSCSECSFKCRFKYYLKKHIRSTHNTVGAKLHVESDNKNGLQQHQNSTKYYCSICERYFSSLIGLQQHHHIDEEPCFKCTHCAKQETHREQLMEHMAAEHKVFIDAPLIASYIPNATTKTSSLQNKATSSSSAVDTAFLNEFLKLQPKEQNASTLHVCQFCGRHFKRHFHLLRHEQLIHPKNIKKENANILKRHTSRFVRKHYARQLLRATQAEHQFKCEPCRHIFKTHVELIAHMQTHGNAKFQCEICQAVFTFEFELKYHKRTHNSPSSSTSPRSENFAPDSNLGLNKALESRLLKFKQQNNTTPKRLALDNIKRRTISKRRLSLASVSTAKSSEEGSLNSPSNANSDEDMSPALLKSSSIDYEYKEDEADATPKSVADVMLPQEFQFCNAKRHLSSSSSSNFVLHKFRSSSPFVDAHGAISIPPTLNDKQLSSVESSDQVNLNDLDLNLLDYNDDFWMELASF